MAHVAISVAMLMPLMGLEEFAEQAADACRHGDKEKAEYGDEDAGKQILPPFGFRALHGVELSNIQSMATMSAEPTMTQRMGTSRSMRVPPLDCPAPSARHF